MNKWALISRSAKRGFTIVELIIVLVVIGILATVVFVGYSQVTSNASDVAVKSDLQKIDDAMKVYKLDNGVYPESGGALVGLGIKLNPDAYYMDNAANVYLCVKQDRSEYAVVAMSKSGKRFVLVSEKGLSDYAGSAVWTESLANANATCSSIDPTYTINNTFGLKGDQWQAWTGVVETLTNIVDNPSVETDIANWTISSGNYSGARVLSGDQWIFRSTRIGTGSAATYIGKTTPYPVSNGQSYTASAYVTASVSGTYMIKVREGVSNTDILSQSYVLTGGAETRMSVSGTLTAPTVHITITSASGAVSDTIVIDKVMLTQGATLYEYADGNSSDWYWVGTANNSVSVGIKP